MKLEFSRQIFEKFLNLELHYDPSVEAELFPAVGQTDMTKLIVAVLNYSNAPNKCR